MRLPGHTLPGRGHRLAPTGHALSGGGHVPIVTTHDLGDYMLASRAVMAADGQSLAVTGLDGDAHGLYHIEGRILVPSATASDLSLRPNGLSINLDARRAANWGAIAELTDWQLGFWSNSFTGAPMEFCFFATLWASKTINGAPCNRQFRAEGTLQGTLAGNDNYSFQLSGQWRDQAQKLESFELVASDPGGVLAGSEVLVYRHSESFGA